jgi:transcription initiation factor TFIIA large subunit
MDGPADGLEGVLLRRGADGSPVELGRVEVDKLLHAQIAARGKQMEGGGLMLPLRAATKHMIPAAEKRDSGTTGQFDGLDDDVKDNDPDDDAINSDLDDPDDDQEDDDDDETEGHIMLCMYDKVQRVKNKW